MVDKGMAELIRASAEETKITHDETGSKSPETEKDKGQVVQETSKGSSTTDVLTTTDTKGKGILITKEPDTVDITDIKPEDFQKELHVKVYRKWASRNVPDPNPTGLCLILLDKQGNAIQGNVDVRDIK